MASKAKPTAGAGRDPYFELVRRFPLRPIRSEVELREAIKVINSLIDRDERSSGEEDYLDVLGDLVEKYEAKEYPVEPVPDAEMLRHLIEARLTTQTQVAIETGIAESTISEVLAGKRTLTRRHIGVLARYFNIDPGVFAFK